jgi:hypothetical protein
MFKLGYHKNNKLEKYNYSDVYNIEQNSSYERIIIGLAQGHINTVLELTSVLSEPFYMLYVLHTPRIDNEPGRYQSESLTYDEISTLLNRFKDFFENDPRHDLWIHSPATNTTIVYDRHNRIYLYGFTDKHIHIIEEMGLKKEAINIPSPHVHNYNAQHDIFESKLINEFEWKRTSLRDEDIQ